MKRILNRLFNFLIFGLALAAGVSDAAWAQSERSMERLISVSGEGVVIAVPDQATVRFSIVTRHKDPEEARRLNAETSREAMNEVRKLGIEERKLQMLALRLQPAWEYNPQTRRNEDLGFEAVRDLVAVVDDLDQLPVLIARIIQKGANRLNDVSYGLKDRDTLRDQAFADAVIRARDKATLMASTLGVELGPVMQISEQSFSMPMPTVRMADQMMMAKAEAAAPEPEAYAAGEIEVRAMVQVTFGIK